MVQREFINLLGVLSLSYRLHNKNVQSSRQKLKAVVKRLHVSKTS